MLKSVANRYQIVKALGRGGGGACYLARDAGRADAMVALKTLAFSEATPELIAAFERECLHLQRVSHPNLARLLDFGRERDRLYYASEYVEGADFVSAARQLNWNAIFSLIAQGSAALGALHAAGIWHRDIKPANILVGKVHVPGAAPNQNRLLLKIIDFGLAVAAAQPRAAGPATGTLLYLAPEQLAEQASDHRADLYAWGLVLYEAALGKTPFADRKNFAELLGALTGTSIDFSPLEASEEIPRGVVAVLKSLLKRDPRQRCADAGWITRELSAIEGESFQASPDADRLSDILRSAAIPELTAATPADDSLDADRIVERVLSLVRAGQRREAWSFAESEWPRIEALPGAHPLKGKFFGAALHPLIELGEFGAAGRYLKRARAALGDATAFDLDIAELQLAYRAGKTAQALRLVESIPEAALVAAESEARTRWENYAGLVLQASGKPLAAAARFETAAQLASRTGRRDHRLSLLINAAAIYQDQERWSVAYRLYREAEALARELGHTALLANALSNLGNLLLYFGRHGEAETAIAESLRLAASLGLKPLAAQNLYLLTVLESAKGNWERVRECLDHALGDAERLGETQPILQAQLAEAYFEFERADYAACERRLQAFRKRSEGTQRWQQEADWLEAKWRIQARQCEGHAVLAWLESAQAAARSSDLKMRLWQADSDLGDYFAQAGLPDRARRSYRDALAAVDALAAEIPEEFRSSFFRDRKKERLRRSLADLPPEPGAPTPAKEIRMSLPPPAPAAASAPQGDVDFAQWTQINRRLLLRQEIDPLLEEILDAAIALTDAERGFVILGERPSAIQIRAARNFDKASLVKEEEKISRSIAREVMKTGATSVIFDAQSEDRFAEARSVHALNLRSVLAVPLRSGPHCVGLVYLDNRYREGVFQRSHIPLVEALADQASLALEHVKLHQQNRDTIDQLKQSKSLIERLNARLEADLDQKTVDLEATRENLVRQNREAALKYRYDKIVGKSPPMRKVLQLLDKIVDATGNVFINGESGTGKELIAQALHYNGPRRDFAFVSENCSAIPETLLESELFGHVRGAFTGADSDKLGLFQLAHRGTLFLDEVGDMPAAMQAKLLRVLQEGEVRQVGGKDYRKVDVRVVAASHRDLRAMVERGEFRQDLFFRLHVLRIDLPPLRERREDIPLLLEHFLKIGDFGGRKPKFTREALRVLLDYRWPGNIRELQNELQRLAAIGVERITPDDLSPHIVGGAAADSSGIAKGLDHALAEVEKRMIREAMEKYRGNKVKVAKALKIGRRTLYAKLDLYRIASDLGK